MLNLLLYILVIMIFWDLSIHLIELFGKAKKFVESKSIFSYYYPHFRHKKTPTGSVERENWEDYTNAFGLHIGVWHLFF